METGDPVISVDTKEKENKGSFKNDDSEYSVKKEPGKALDHDFPFNELGKIVPYGVYTVNNNVGFVNLGTSTTPVSLRLKHFALEGDTEQPYLFKREKRYIRCECGGNNGNRVKM